MNHNEKMQQQPLPTENQQPRQLTPSELVHHHIRHPEQPITDDDIRNLKLDLDSTLVTEEGNIEHNG